ncbi:MAG: anti-sigma factor [Pseudomonadota bacterium]
MSDGSAGPTDEMLMAYADGETSPAETDVVEAAIASDPAVAERFAVFAETRALAQAAFPAHEPVPDALRDAVRAMVDADAQERASAHDAAQDEDNVVAFAPRPRPAATAPPRRSQTMMAMAASVVAVAVGVGAYFAGASSVAPPGDHTGVATLAGLDLAPTLATLPSGESTDLTGDTRFTAVAAFRDGAGALCREFEVDGSGERVLGVACHRDGDWRVDFAVATLPASDSFVPASSTETLDAYLTTVSAEAPLEPEAESEALKALSGN